MQKWTFIKKGMANNPPSQPEQIAIQDWQGSGRDQVVSFPNKKERFATNIVYG